MYHPVGWFREEEGLELQKLVKSLKKDAIIVEIGTWCGRSASYISEVLGDQQTFFTLDHYISNSKPEKNSGISVAAAKQTFLSLFFGEHLYKKHIFSIHGESEIVSEAFREARTTIDMLFIDGDHDYENAKLDHKVWSIFKPHVVVLHDYHNCPGVNLLVEEIRPLYNIFREVRSLAIFEKETL